MTRKLLAAAAALALCACEPPGPPAGGAQTPEAAAPAAPVDVDAARAQFDTLVESITTELLRLSPETATYLGVDEAAAGGRYNDRLDDYSPRGRDRMLALTREALALLEAADPAALDDARRLTRATLTSQLEAGLDAQAAAGGWGSPGFGSFTPYLINTMTGPHIDIPNLMAVQQPVATPDEAAMYISRLTAIDYAFDGVIESLEADRARGAVPPDFVLDKALATIVNFIEPEPTENLLYTSLAEKLAAADVPDAEIVLESAETAIRDLVYPAFAELAAELEVLRAEAVHDAGLSARPNGAALYDAMIRIGADSSLTADEVHQIGLDEVERIAAEMDAILTAEGRAEGAVAERMQALNVDPAFIEPNTDEGRAALIALTEAQLAEAWALMPQWFGVLPPQSVEVRRVPEFSEASAAPAYYDTPSVDGSRPGIFWLNLRDTAIHPTWMIKTIAYHEAIPGHHIQVALAFDRRDLPLLRRNFGGTTAFVEGWGLYAERLAKEMGLYEGDPYGDLGRLRADMWRAVRLVADSGLHAKGWSREQAIDYMIDVGGIDPNTSEQEVERYASIPGQALGYKIGMLKLLELRARAEGALGDRFDIRAFHDAVLLDAGLPLPVLEERIDAWIAGRSSGP